LEHMTRLQPSLMEVTRALADRARAARFNFGEDTAIVAVQHMLWQTIDLFEAVVSLGVKRENIFALGKVYSNSPIVIGALRDQGITIVESTMPAPGEFKPYFVHDVECLWEVVARTLARRNIKRILVLDDGGRCITRMPVELSRKYQVAGVEQTSFGMFLFEEDPPPFAVVSWARAAVKLHIGGPIFSHCLLTKLQSRVLGGDLLTNEDAGIIGLGSIGSAMAHLLVRQRNRVLYYDPDPHVPSYLHGRVTRADSLEELMLRSNYVFGCSGRQPFKDQWPVRYRPGIKLFSASAGDQEFNPLIKDLINTPNLNVTPHAWDICAPHGPSGPITIAYMGYPYNFVSRDIEAVPTAVVQIETGGLLAALLQARLHLSISEAEEVQNRGIQRTSPEAQSLIYETWRTAMKGRRIDLHQVYGFDRNLLHATRQRWWFFNHSEPQPSLSFDSNLAVENLMAHIIDERHPSEFGYERQFEPDLSPF
ncbi:MAG TPA: NAD(P)-dependent oxidoreductase, partial [Pyrinomonadaceae bacterium]|nr:NAD(P)-dependent oxidoreductase [Pyrinomonadaceae bacterium]